MTQDPATDGLQAYIVGGAVRDALLGLPPGDHDWVVVGATPEDMVRRGFIPVGGDFPVFLHPRTKEEYALARTERKSGRGYKGFTFYTGADVTLEEDLRRRDLTVNAIAQTRDGQRVDPLGGEADVRARVFRHVGEAFQEDPVRILRLGRFAARFDDFTVAPETLALCRRMVGDESAARDLVQDVFVRAWERLPTFRGQSALATWMHRLAVNVVLEQLRSTKRDVARFLDDADQDALPARPASPDIQMDLDRAVAQLPTGARTVFVLHDVHGYSHDEIAQMTGIAAGTARAQLFRARRALMRLLDL